MLVAEMACWEVVCGTICSMIGVPERVASPKWTKWGLADVQH